MSPATEDAARTGIVVVSHSHALAVAARDLAAEMGAGARIELAAGLDETTFGTDATAVSAAIERVLADGPDDGGCVVLLDLGSAVLSAELATDLLDPDLAARVRLCPAPLVEGLVVAAVAAAGGAPPERVAAEAERALAPKRQALGLPEDEDADPSATSPESAESAESAESVESVAPAEPEHTVEIRILDPAGLHARPAALLAAKADAAEAVVTATNLDTGRGPVVADSMLELMTLGLATSARLGLGASGPGAEETLRSLVALVEEEVNAPFR